MNEPEAIKTTVYDWPMRQVPVTFGKVTQLEWRAHCPKCGGRNIVRDSVPSGIGSGSGGSHRMGDNYRPRVTCQDCGETHIGPVKTMQSI